jgi:hypothetical protein
VNPADFHGAVDVTFTDGRKVKGNVAAAESTGNDLAAILIDAADARDATGVAPAAPKPGETLYQLGWTGAKGPFPRSGPIEPGDFGAGKYSLDMRVDGGDSGSGVFNAQRQLVAVICWKYGPGVQFGPGKGLAVDHARVHRFYEACLRGLFGKKQPDAPRQPPAPDVPPVPPQPAPPQVPPGDTFDRLKDRLDGLRGDMDEFKRQYGELKDGLTGRIEDAERWTNGRVGGALDKLDGFRDRVETWIGRAEGLAGLAGVLLSGGGIGGVAFYLLRRRLQKRFSRGSAPAPAAQPPATSPNPAVVVVEGAPLQPQTRVVTDYVRVPSTDPRRVALETAMNEYAKRNPGALDTIETLKAYAEQIHSGMQK